MTHNPTPAEVQAAYDNAVEMLERKHFALTDDVKVLLAALARDTLGWRRVDRETWIKHQGPSMNIPPLGIGTDLWLIKDAAP